METNKNLCDTCSEFVPITDESQKFKLILYIVLFVFLFVFIGVIILLFVFRENIRNNWSKYKCNPIIMPFASFFNKNSDENYGECLFGGVSNIMGVFLEPINYTLQLISNIFAAFTKAINEIRTVIYRIRIFFLWIVQDIMKRFEDTAATLQYFFAKLKDIFMKVYTVFIVLIYMLYTVYMTVWSIWEGPIGTTVRTICFDGNTQIEMNDKTYKNIKDIQINDTLANSNKVISRLKFKYDKNIEMYKFDNIIVSGEHKIYLNNKIQKISEIPDSKKINYNSKYIYCLITENNHIIINNYNFLDFIECSNYNSQYIIRKLILNSLNNKSIYHEIFDIVVSDNKRKRNSEKDYYLNGFYGNVKLKLNEDTYKKIKDIKIGDILEGNNVVTGKIKQKVMNNDIIYKLNDIITSGNQIVYYDKNWQLVSNIDKCNNIYYDKCNYLYNITTSKKIIKINNIIFRDYLENDNIIVNKKIDCISKY